MSIIYKITNTINGKIYIGQSKFSLDKRWKEHLRDYNRSYKNNHFYNAIRKYGIDCWIFEVLEEVNDISNLNEAEMKWIEYYDTFNNGYNSTTGGDGGYIRSEEVLKKLSVSLKGRIPWNKGNRKEKLFKCKKNIPKSEEHKMKIGEANRGENNGNYGKIYTEEEKLQISIKLKGRVSPMKGKKWTEEQKEKLKGRIPWNKKKEVETPLIS